MPEIFRIIKYFGNTATKSQIGFMMMAELGVTKKYTDKIFRDCGFALSLLKNFEIVEQVKQSVWTLADKYKNKSYEEMKEIIKEKYKDYYLR